MSKLKQTPIYDEYKKWGAKTIDFGGWDMPVSFSGIMKEHHAVRNEAGLFDVSHMGEIIVTGKDSIPFLQKVTTNNIEKLEPNKAQYTFMCKEDGGTIEDLLVYMLNDNHYMLVVNAANKDKDLKWLKKHMGDFHVDIDDRSNEIALLAIQGPNAVDIVQQLTNIDLQSIRPFHFEQEVEFHPIEDLAIVSRTGYTGEDGFEIYIDKNSATTVWNALLKIGETKGLIPAGLGARDTLRFEAGLPLYGQELEDSISPIETGLTFAVKVQKSADFIGKSVLTKQVNDGVTRRLVGLEILDKGIARTDNEVYTLAGDKIGYITTGTKSPTLNKVIANALVDIEYTELEQEMIVQVRKRKLKAKVTNTPFYKRTR